MSGYVDGFVIPIPKKNIKSYKKMASLGCKVWMEHGAVDYVEAIGDDLKVKWGWTFPRMCKLKAGETAVFAYIFFKSKAHRDRVNAKVFKDPRMQMDGTPMPFDMKRFAVGGFKTLVKSKKRRS
jgi:uncharacterized protein YbaA (DUF1428 family)